MILQTVGGGGVGMGVVLDNVSLRSDIHRSVSVITGMTMELHCLSSLNMLV